MKSLIAVAIVAASLAAVSAPANAFTFGGGQITVSGPEIVQVGWRCGPFRHFDSQIGRCVWNHRHWRWHY